jgi:hypothetical protein
MKLALLTFQLLFAGIGFPLNHPAFVFYWTFHYDSWSDGFNRSWAIAEMGDVRNV